MRLYLSSFQFGNRPGELTRFAGTGLKTAVILNARDYQESAQRQLRLGGELAKLTELGFVADEIDLRDYFGKADALRARLEEYGMAWVSGGNVFLLRSAMAQSGFDTIVKARIADESLVYAGYSAAGCVLSPSIDAYAIVDDAKFVQATYGVPVQMDGLSVLDYYFEPHYKSDHPESAAVDKEIELLEAKKLSYMALSDGEVLMIDGDGSSETVVS